MSERTRRDPRERFWEKVRKTDGCWIWEAAKDKHGYGKFNDGERIVCAHQFSYHDVTGVVIEKGMHIDHLCRNPSCVNPEHLEQVTPKVNLFRGVGFAATNAAKTHCLKQHPYSGDNLYVDPQGHRHCRTCMREYDRRRHPRKR